jgi:solute:Na+ symporter, SSS family
VISNFSLIDSIILAVYLIIVLSIGFNYSRKRDRNTKDYFLAGRNMGWVVVGLSIFATNISSEHFIGLAGAGSSKGLVVGQFELMAIFVLILLGWFLAPIYIKSGVSTMPEFLGQRFDPKIRKIFAALSILIYIFTKISITLFAGGILFYKIFGLNIYASAIVIIFITGLYCVIGGAHAVMRTQVFQAILLLLGAIVLTLFGLNEVGGISGLKAKLPGQFFNMFKPASDPDFPWTGIIFGAPIIAFWYWCADQYIVQRLLSAKSEHDARRGTLLVAFLKILPIFILVMPGLIAIILYPEISGDEAYPMLLASDLLPIGIKGFVVAGLLAAIMSSLAGVFNSMAALFTNDFYKLKHPDASERELVLVGRLTTTLVVIAAILCVPLVKIITNQVYLYLQSLQGYVSPPITAVFVFGLLSKKITGKAALWTLIIGEILGLFRLGLDMGVNTGYISNPILVAIKQINFLHFAIILFVICSVLIVVLSLFTVNRKVTEERSFNYSIQESYKEFSYNLSNSGSINGYKSNLILSVFILIIIISMWSLW